MATKNSNTGLYHRLLVICGIDEAGRGPAIGPMVLAAVAVTHPAQLPRGLKDSKLLTREKREELFEKVVQLPCAVRIVWPAEVDEWVARKGLNWLEAKHTIGLAKELEAQRLIVDCPHRTPATYQAYLSERLPGIRVDAMFKADQKYKLVSAASIIAKVVRDRLIDAIKRECGVECGSGYLTDPLTQAFLDDFDPDFPYFRKSWSSYKDRIRMMEQETLL